MCLSQANALFTLLGHEAPVIQAIHVAIVCIPSAKACRQGQQACIVLLDFHKVPTLFLYSALF